MHNHRVSSLFLVKLKNDNPFFHVGTTNNFLSVEVVGVSTTSDARINCIFLSGFTGSAHCTLQYGTTPTYMNLPYSAESTETGTAGDTVSVVLREQLNSSTVYYYTVSAVSGDVTVTVRGNFTTPLYSEYLYIQMTRTVNKLLIFICILHNMLEKAQKYTLAFELALSNIVELELF